VNNHRFAVVLAAAVLMLHAPLFSVAQAAPPAAAQAEGQHFNREPGFDAHPWQPEPGWQPDPALTRRRRIIGFVCLGLAAAVSIGLWFLKPVRGLPDDLDLPPGLQP